MRMCTTKIYTRFSNIIVGDAYKSLSLPGRSGDNRVSTSVFLAIGGDQLILPLRLSLVAQHLHASRKVEEERFLCGYCTQSYF